MCIVSFFFGQMDASKPRQIVLSARAHGPALFYVCPARCIYLCPETFLNGRADRLAFFYFFLASASQVHPSMCRLGFLNARDARPAFVYFFPARCIHPCPGEHSRVPWPTDLHLFIAFQPGAFTHVQVSIPKCHGQWTCIYLFLSSQVHPSVSW